MPAIRSLRTTSEPRSAAWVQTYGACVDNGNVHPYPKQLSIHRCIHATDKSATKTQQPCGFRPTCRFRPEAPKAVFRKFIEPAILNVRPRVFCCPRTPGRTVLPRLRAWLLAARGCRTCGECAALCHRAPSHPVPRSCAPPAGPARRGCRPGKYGCD